MPVDEVTGIPFEVEGEVSPEGVLQSEDEREVSPKQATPAAEPAAVVKTESPAYEYAPRTASRSSVELLNQEPVEETPVVETPAEQTEFTEAELVEAEAELEAYLEAQLAEKVDERTRAIQSTKDKEVKDANQRAQERIDALEAQLEEVKLDGLTDEEKSAYLDSKKSEKERTELLAAADELDVLYKGRVVDLYMTEYGPYGVTREELESIEDADEAEKFCERVKGLYLRISGGKEPGTADETPVAAKPAAKPAPAGATAPADIGGGAPTLGGPTKVPSTEQSSAGMAQTMDSLPWVSVRLPGA